MDEKSIVSKVNEFLYSATRELCKWLGKMLPRVSDDWWQECVINNLTFAQQEMSDNRNYSTLEQFDLAALLRITNKSWYDMRAFAYLPNSQRECVRSMMKVRNNWAHCAGLISDKDVVIRDLQIILEFFETVIITNVYSDDIKELVNAVETADFSAIHDNGNTQPIAYSDNDSRDSDNGDIVEKDRVFLTGEPDIKGMVFSVSEVDGVKKYDVFVDGNIKTFYDGQIQRIESTPLYKWVDLDTFQSNLTAYEINNPSAGNLYSLNSARVDFVPYQFRPALKLIKSDEPRILIADSVGVGKTIEAGLIIKELEARNELESIAVICPKPLVTERKWELEMKRFDEDFTSLTGPELRQVLSDTDRDQEWPSRYNKVIIPYSILDNRIYEGGDHNYGLLDIDPAPHFDLVIIDEAHHIRNGSLDKEKAYAYKCTRYFCEHADAVVMLTATPLQTKDDDLFTLLNLLRPDVIMDTEVFRMMSRPNGNIYRASHLVRMASTDWQAKATEELLGVTNTQWGENVIAKNPVYSEVLSGLKQDSITRESRIKLITDIESLHSFNTMLNRTRRKDMQDFCIRRSYTVETAFTVEQRKLHDELLQFEYKALAKLHNVRTIPFMMSMIRRQAASCIFGLGPQIRDIISRRFDQLVEDPDVEIDEYDLDEESTSELLQLAQHILEVVDDLPDDDPKFDSALKVIEEKQQLDNNKIILFSTFRHTLSYLRKKLESRNYRVGQIDGSIKDESRRNLRKRFELDKSDPYAIDIMLFTEVGSEGLDYQFCDTMINYDLPWNPMRIEQRIGRIDRRGQESEAVNIYNIITKDTVDADIYTRCLMRIGIFERSIGECEEVLGTIGTKIEQIAINTELTEEERRQKLEQMADNEVRRMQELSRLEDEEHALFGFDLSNYTATKEIKDAESPWISPLNIQHLVERYLSQRLGEGCYIVGSSELKQLRLGKAARMELLDDFRKLPNIKSSLNRKWELFLKGDEPMHQLTFTSEAASDSYRAFFITPMHPLVKQAAKHFASNDTMYLNMEYYSDILPTGEYYFSIYAWNYIGVHQKFKIVPVCNNDLVEAELIDILQDAETVPESNKNDNGKWEKLENKHIQMWQEEKAKYIKETQNIANYKLESISSNYRSRKRNLEQKIRDAFEERIVRMYESELNSATENYNSKVARINDMTNRADIHIELIANGILIIKKG